MLKKKLTAIVTAALILVNSLPVYAKPEGVYLKSQSGENLYINYNDYVKGYASRNKNFMDTIKNCDITGISVETPNSKNVIDFKAYVDDYKNNNIKNVDDYSDKKESKKYKLPEKVKELHKDGTIDSKEITPPDNEKNNFISILSARKKSDGEIVTVKGIVTSVIGNNAFVQDETSGIYIYLGPTNNTDLVVGNELLITGPINTYNDLKQIKDPTEVVVKSTNNDLPKETVTTVSGIKEEYQGMRISIKNLTITSVSKPEKNGSYNVFVKDATGTITIRVDGFLEPKIAASNFKVGSVIDITSTLGRFRNDNQLMISNLKEMKVISEGSGETPTEKGIPINKIQGRSHKSPLEGQTVSDVKGIVTAISNDGYQKGFFMQNPNPDNDPATSEGIFVKYDNNSTVKVGDEVSVDGTVKEIVNGLQKDCVPETVLAANRAKVNSNGNKLPEPVKITFNESLAKNIDDDNMTTFDIDKDAIDYYESLEGMLVKIDDPVIVGADERYGEICVLADNGKFSEHQRTPNGGIKAYADDFNPEIITIDDVLNPITNNKTKKFYNKNFKVTVGDKFDSSIVGVMSSGFGKYKVFNIGELPKITPGKTKKEATSIQKDKNKLTVASFNVENLSKNSGDRLQQIGNAIVTYLNSPDIVGLSEILDNDGETKSGVTDASETYKALIDAINKAGGPEYGYTDIAPVNGQDGGVPGGNIRVGFIYVKDRVTLVNKPKGDATTEVAMTDTGLSVNPGRISPKDNCFERSRKPVVAQFKFNGEDVFVIGNHLNSKRGDASLFSMKQPPVRGSEPQRHRQVALINSFIKEILDKKPDANIITLGDMNDYEFSETLTILKGNEMKNMIEKLPVNERFSYVFNGNSQVLDHLLVCNKLYDNTEVDIVNINSQSTEGKLSDHDPVLVQIDLGIKNDLTDAEAVEKSLQQLSLGDTNGITSDISLRTKGAYGTTIQWKSDKPEFISNEGVVVRPENEDVTVILIATIKKGDKTAAKKFTVKVLKKEGSTENPEEPHEELIHEGFDDVSKLQHVWDIKVDPKSYTNPDTFGKASPALKFKNTGHYVMTPNLKTAAKELSFWIKGNGTDGKSILKVEGLVNGEWKLIEDVVPSTRNGEIKTYKVQDKTLIENVTQIKFSYTKSNGNVAFDDVIVK